MKDRGRPKSKEEATETVGVRLPLSVKGKFKALAKAEKRSLAAMLRIALESYAEGH